MMSFRHLTLAWPGLPWLWLRGSLAGLVLALAFGLSLDVAVVTTFVWPDLVELPVTLGLWAAVALVWVVGTASAVAAFPPPLARPRAAEVDPLFVKARAAYLARDWLAAERRLRELLAVSPTDGEAQLLLGTLLRRVGRLDEAREALEKLSISDAGAGWRAATAAELARIAAARRGSRAAGGAATRPLLGEGSGGAEGGGRRAAA